MTTKQRQKIEQLTRSGKRQAEIASLLGIHRNSVYRAQKELGLSAKPHGPRSPMPTKDQEARILELLSTGVGTSRIAEQLGLRCHAVRCVSKKHGFRHKRGPGQRHRLSSVKRAKILDEIQGRQNHALSIAHKYRTSYKLVLKLAHEMLACPRFRSGYGEPLASNFPQRHFRKGKA